MFTCAIMQPTYLPWIGYFDLIDSVDVFVFLDSVQLERQSWQTRNCVKGPKDTTIMLSIPVRRTPHATTTISDAQTDEHAGWRRKHLATIENCYRKAPHCDQVLEMLRACLSEGDGRLSRITEPIIQKFAAAMGISTKLMTASKLGPFTSTRDRLLVEICSAVGANRYLSARGSAVYIEEHSEAGAFAGSGVELVYQRYEHPTYPQVGTSFVPYMAIPDLVANLGFSSALEVIRSGRREPLSSVDIVGERDWKHSHARDND